MNRRTNIIERKAYESPQTNIICLRLSTVIAQWDVDLNGSFETEEAAKRFDPSFDDDFDFGEGGVEEWDTPDYSAPEAWE